MCTMPLVEKFALFQKGDEKRGFVMNEEELVTTINKIRLQIRADADLSDELGTVLEKACKAAGVSPPEEFFDGLMIVHSSEMDTEFSVTILPVGSQCGL